jgi:membrane protein DedA with SNARE-associated domain
MDQILEQYGLAASFGVMFFKAAGLPIPIPGDVILLAIAARAAQGKMLLWQAFLTILLALVLGGVIQFWLARGPARRLVYRYGRYLGLTPARLDSAATRVRKSSPVGIALAILTPGVRTVTVAACGLAGLRTSVFLIGLVVGVSIDVTLHFFLGYVGGALLAELALPLLIGLVIAGLVIWVGIRLRQHPGAKAREVVAEAYEGWQEATCPACLILATLNPGQPG